MKRERGVALITAMLLVALITPTGLSSSSTTAIAAVSNSLMSRAAAIAGSVTRTAGRSRMASRADASGPCSSILAARSWSTSKPSYRGPPTGTANDTGRSP